MTVITRFWPFGPHGTVSNKLTGISDHWRELNAIGVPVSYKGVDGYGALKELMDIGDLFGVENIGVFRLSGKNNGNFDVPNWFAPTPEIAAGQHCTLTLNNLPPEFDKRVWLELINEPDKDEDSNLPTWTPAHFANWLGKFMQECARIMLPQGYKILGFGYSSGESELEDWETEGVLGYLKMCAEHHESLGLALHEYSYVSTSLEYAVNEYPWQLGRFTKVFEICDKHGIKRPKVAITEFGWTLWNMPDTDEALAQLRWAATEIYAIYPEILSVAIWNFGDGWKRIADKAQTLLVPMKNIAKTWRVELDVDDAPTEPPVAKSDKQRWWDLTIKEQITNGIQLAPTAIQDAVRRDKFHPVTKEMYVTGEPPLMAAEDWANGVKPRRVYGWKNGNVFFFEDPEDDGMTVPLPVPPPIQPPPGSPKLDMRPYFFPTSEFGPLFELRNNSGSQQRIQHQISDGVNGRSLYITKGGGGANGKSEWEHLYDDGAHIYRGIDTSPGNGRFYIQYETGLAVAKWIKRFMSVGETFVGPTHNVQFYLKSNCSPSSDNSGEAVNVTTLFAHYKEIVMNGITVRDVIHLGRDGGEEFWFAKGLGMVGWKSQWGEAFISELHASGQRPNNQREEICNFTLP